MVPTPWRAPTLEITLLSAHSCASTNMNMRGGTLDELMRSRGSITGIDLFGGVTLAIGVTVTAAVWCLGLAVRAVQETAADVNETMRHRVGADTYLSHSGQGVVLLPHSMRDQYHPRLCAAHIPCSSCAPEDAERPLLGWLPVMLQSLHCARK
jgi:hypothetical protein